MTATRLQVEGGVPLRGSVRISGAKNAALPIMAASLMTREPSRLQNAPHLADVDNAMGILRALGAEVERSDDGVITLRAAGEIGSEVDPALAQQMRASILFMGPLLARTGRAVVPKPGGDDIGMRRVDQHVYGLERLGARIEEQDGSFVCEAERRLHGAAVQLDMPTVTGTENIMMAAAVADGHTTISNAAREPHVADLAAALNSMGARRSPEPAPTASTSRASTNSEGYDHRVTPDYLEAGTYMIAAAAAGGDVELLDTCPLDDLLPLVLKLRQAGVEIEDQQGWMRVQAHRRAPPGRPHHLDPPRLCHRPPAPVHGPDDPGQRDHDRSRSSSSTTASSTSASSRPWARKIDVMSRTAAGSRSAARRRCAAISSASLTSAPARP